MKKFIQLCICTATLITPNLYAQMNLNELQDYSCKMDEAIYRISEVREEM